MHLLVSNQTNLKKLINHSKGNRTTIKSVFLLQHRINMPNPSINILLADDDDEDLELIENAILDIEPAADVHKVTNGKAVIEYLNGQPENKLPCLIILDYNMPELNGAEVLALIYKEKRYENISKVILSTSGSPAYIQNCINNGALEYFIKPNNMGDFFKLAKKMLDHCNTANS